MIESKFNPDAPFSLGFIASLDRSKSSAVRFGGEGWVAEGGRQELGNPVLLMTLDLTAPEVVQSIGRELPFEIPLFSYVNLEGVIGEQEYVLDHAKKLATFSSFEDEVEILSAEDCLPTPFPESSLSLRKMKKSEVPVDEDSYWSSVDSFLGGNGFLRVLGKPVYTADVTKAGDDFLYLASIGYESFDDPSGVVADESFYLGEMAHYFFVSKDWQKIKVLTQA